MEIVTLEDGHYEVKVENGKVLLMWPSLDVILQANSILLKPEGEKIEEYKSFIIYDSKELQEKMKELEGEGWKVTAITNEYETGQGVVLQWRIWIGRKTY